MTGIKGSWKAYPDLLLSVYPLTGCGFKSVRRIFPLSVFQEPLRVKDELKSLYCLSSFDSLDMRPKQSNG